MSYIRILLATALLATVAACGGNSGSAGNSGSSTDAKQVAPSALVGSASTYDGKSVSVSGTVRHPHQRQTARGEVVRYQLCDSGCIHVVQFGNATVTDGSTASVAGTFHADFGKRRHTKDVLVVGSTAQ